MSKTPTNERVYSFALTEDDHAATQAYMESHGIQSRSEFGRLAVAKLLKRKPPREVKRGRPATKKPDA